MNGTHGCLVGSEPHRRGLHVGVGRVVQHHARLDARRAHALLERVRSPEGVPEGAVQRRWTARAHGSRSLTNVGRRLRICAGTSHDARRWRRARAVEAVTRNGATQRGARIVPARRKGRRKACRRRRSAGSDRRSPKAPLACRDPCRSPSCRDPPERGGTAVGV